MNKTLCTCGGALVVLGYSRAFGPYYFAECVDCKGVWYVKKSGEEYVRA
jgi:hypothetical protein